MNNEKPTDFGVNWLLCDDPTEGDIILFDEPVWKRGKGKKSNYKLAGKIRIIAQAKDRNEGFLSIQILHAYSLDDKDCHQFEITEKIKYLNENPATKRKLSKLAKIKIYRTKWTDEFARSIISQHG